MSLQRLWGLIGRVPADGVIRGLVSTLCEPNPVAIDEGTLASRLRDDPAQLQDIIEELLARPAGARHRAPEVLATSIRPKYLPEIVSLGTHCFTSSFLQRWDLRRWSGPFDWIFSSIPMVTHCIEDDFYTFLDRNLYKPVPLDDRPDGADVNRVDHIFYREQFGIAYVFNHHDVHLDEAHAYLHRCVERFRRCLKSTAPKVFVFARKHKDGLPNELEALSQTLHKRTANFAIVGVDVRPPTPEPSESPVLDQIVSVGQLHVSSFQSVSAWEPLRFTDLIDEYVLARHIVQKIQKRFELPAC